MEELVCKDCNSPAHVCVVFCDGTYGSKIQFRGKSISTGEWIEGNFIHRGQTGLEYIRNNDSLLKVYPATVGQYVFLEDADDKKIFTGDILQDKSNGDLYVVDFIGGGFGLFTMKEYIDLKHRHQVILWDGLSELQTSCFVMQNLRVIGNIYDNPELIDEGGVSQ